MEDSINNSSGGLVYINEPVNGSAPEDAPAGDETNREGGSKNPGNINMNHSEALVVCIFSFAAAVLYSACFTGTRVYPQLSLFVFTMVSTFLLYRALSKITYLKNKKAFKWAVPLIIISSFNAVFHLNLFSYANVLAVHLMFAALAFSAVKGLDNDLSEMSGWLNLVKVCLGNLIAAFRIFKTVRIIKKERSANALARVAIGALIAAPVLLVLTVVLMDADAVFNAIMKNMFNYFVGFNINIIGHIAAVAAVTVYFAGYVYNLKELKPSGAKIVTFKIDNIIGSTFLALINLLFLFFCVIQTAFLFTGGYMRLPEGIVYSAYAREGFFQLLFVTVINFGVLIIFLKIFPDSVKSKILKTMLTMLCFFTAILIFSSFYRMFLYIDAYGYTGIRMMVITFLAMEILLVIVTLRYLYRPDTDFIKSYIYISVVFYMLVNITSSAYVVGRLNVNRFYAGKDLDVIPLCQSAETAGLLAEVFDRSEFFERLPEDKIRYSYDALVKLSQTDEGGWQNLSLISGSGRRLARSAVLKYNGRNF